MKLTNDCVLTIDAFGMQSEHYVPTSNQWINDNNVPVSLYGFGGELGAGFTLPNGKVYRAEQAPLLRRAADLLSAAGFDDGVHE